MARSTLAFIDILGFAGTTLRDRRRTLRESSPDFDLSQTSDMANQANRFSSVLEQMLNRERQNSRVRGMIFSDCAFIDLGTPYQTASIAAELMRILIHARLPVRMGIGRGTFYAEQFGTTVVGTSVFAKNIFFGTGVVRAYRAERCGGAGMRIFIDRSAVNGLVSQSRLRLVALPKQLDGVTHELDYLTDRPTAAYDKEEESFARLAAMYPKGKPLRVRRQYIDTFKAMNAMRKARGRPPIRYQALPGYKTPSV